MSLLKQIFEREQQTELFVSQVIELAEQIISETTKKHSIGLVIEQQDRHAGQVQIKRGDLIIRVDGKDKDVVVATGEFEDGKPVVRSKGGQLDVIEPELLIIGVQSSNDVVKKAAGRLASKYPDRRVLVYGDLPKKGM